MTENPENPTTPEETVNTPNHINPHAVTDYNRSVDALACFALFCVAVAGKASKVQSPKVAAFISALRADLGVSHWNALSMVAAISDADLRARLEAVKLGQYTRITRTYRALAGLGDDLSGVSLEALQAACGLKTSRFFLLHSRPDVRVAVLDTHILAWLREQGHAAPKSTPQSPKSYARLESVFLRLCDEKGLSPAAFDLAIWSSRAK
mgnify:CR=1 FL=1